MVIGFDLDGVIVRHVVPQKWLRRFSPFLILAMQKLDFLRALYYRRMRVNPKLTITTRFLADLGHRIVIISGHSSSFKEEVINCLERHLVKFHAAYLCPNDDEGDEFKLKYILYENCSVFVDDQSDTVEFLSNLLTGRCKVIHYQGQSPYQIIQQISQIKA